MSSQQTWQLCSLWAANFASGHQSSKLPRGSPTRNIPGRGSHSHTGRAASTSCAMFRLLHQICPRTRPLCAPLHGQCWPAAVLRTLHVRVTQCCAAACGLSNIAQSLTDLMDQRSHQTPAQESQAGLGREVEKETAVPKPPGAAAAAASVDIWCQRMRMHGRWKTSM